VGCPGALGGLVPTSDSNVGDDVGCLGGSLREQPASAIKATPPTSSTELPIERFITPLLIMVIAALLTALRLPFTSSTAARVPAERCVHNAASDTNAELAASSLHASALTEREGIEDDARRA
jgi:hypothetical protein